MKPLYPLPNRTPLYPAALTCPLALPDAALSSTPLLCLLQVPDSHDRLPVKTLDGQVLYEADTSTKLRASQVRSRGREL